MANTTLDVAIKVKGRGELDLLIKRMDKLEKESDQTKQALKEAFSRNTFSGINQGTTALSRFSKETIAAQRQLDKLKKTGASVQALNIGVSGAAAAGVGTGAAAAGGAVALGIQAAAQGQQELNNLTGKYADIQDKLNSNLSRQQANQAEIDELTRRRPFVEGQTSEKIKQSALSLAKQKAELSSIDQKLKSLNASQRGLIPLADKYEKELAAAGGQVQKTNNRLTRQQTLMKGLQGTASKIGKGFGRVGNLVAGAGLGLFAKSAFDAAANVENLQARTKILATEFTQLAGIEQVAAASADRLKLSNSQVLASYIDLGNRLGEQGTSLNDIQQVYEGLNTVLVKNKSSTQEAASATLQLNQALGAGRLAGEEFRAVNEAAPQVISEIADVLGVARGEVKGLAADGLVSSQVVIQALTNINKKGAAQLEEGFTGAFKAQREFNKALIEFKEVVGSELLPVITPFIAGLTELLKGFGQLDPFVQKAIIGFTAFSVGALILAPAIVAVGKAMFGLAGFIGALKLGAAAAGVGKLSLAFVGLKVALLALPWVAVAAGVTALGVAMYQTSQRQRELNALINDGAGTTQQLTDKKAELEQRLQAVRGKLDGTTTGIKATAREASRLRTEAALLEGQLTKLAKTYTIRLDLVKRGFGFDEQGNASTYKVNGITYDAVTGQAVNPPQTVSQIIESQIKPVTTSGGTGGGSKGSGSAPRESQVPQLKQELEASEKLLNINRQLLDAQLAEDTALVQQLEATRILIEYENKLAEIALEKIPAVEKELKGKIALTEAMGAQAELANTVNTDERDRLATLQQTLTGFDREVELSRQKNDWARKLLQIEYDILDARDQGLLKTPEEIESYRERATAAAEVTKELSGSKQMMSDAYDIVSGELTNSIEGLIDGTKEWGDVLSDIAGQLGKMFLNAGFNGLGSVLGFADGGRPPMNQVSVVGERGPELFVPDSAGTVLSNQDSRAALSNYSGGNASAAGAMAPMAANVTYSGPTLNFNGDDYIPRSEAPALVAAGAKQGQARAMSTLKNSRSQRQKLGM